MNWKMCLCFRKTRVFTFFSRTEKNHERATVIPQVVERHCLWCWCLISRGPCCYKKVIPLILSHIVSPWFLVVFKTAVGELVKAGVYVLNCLFNIIIWLGYHALLLFNFEKNWSRLKPKNKNKLNWNKFLWFWGSLVKIRCGFLFTVDTCRDFGSKLNYSTCSSCSISGADRQP